MILGVLLMKQGRNVTLTKTFSDKVKANQGKQQLPKSKVEVNKNN